MSFATIRDTLVAPATLILAAVLLSGCASKDRPDRQSDCARARSRYAQMKKSLHDYYAAGTTSSVQIEIAKSRLARAKKAYEEACGRGYSR
jgi:hypothetical protein